MERDNEQPQDAHTQAEADIGLQQPADLASPRDDLLRQDVTGGLIDTTPADADAAAEIDVARGTTGFQGAGSPAVGNPRDED